MRVHRILARPQAAAIGDLVIHRHGVAGMAEIVAQQVEDDARLVGIAWECLRWRLLSQVLCWVATEMARLNAGQQRPEAPIF